MNLSLFLRISVLALALVTTSCKHYAVVKEKTPKYKSKTPAGLIITEARRNPAKTPQEQMGRYIDAAATAGEAIKANPADKQAISDYNYAVSRLFETLHHSGLKPWKAPLLCPGEHGPWKFSMTHDGKKSHDPDFFRILPADRYQFKGTLVRERVMKDGLGAPMIIASHSFDPTKYDPFIMGPNLYYGITEVLQFNGRDAVAAYQDPLSTETVNFGGHTFPLAADFTTPIGLALAELKPRKLELQRMFNPSQFVSSTRLARLQPYDPNKIPVLCIHGLGDSQATWAPLIEAIRGDDVLRKHYQVWFFSYPTGYPYPLMAAVLRQKMDAINAFHRGHKKYVVIGHSMGAMIARTLLTDTGMKLWDAYYDVPPEKVPLSPEARKTLMSAFIYKPRTDIARVIFMSGSHRGADMATSFFGNIGRKLIGGPANIIGEAQEESEAVALTKPDESGAQLRRMPNSIDALNPKNRYLTTIDTIPLTRSIPYHSVIGDRGKGGNLDRTPPVSTDGIVPYWSSHLEGAQSEKIVPSGHWSNQHPDGIKEVKRILYLHLNKTLGY